MTERIGIAQPQKYGPMVKTLLFREFTFRIASIESASFPRQKHPNPNMPPLFMTNDNQRSKQVQANQKIASNLMMTGPSRFRGESPILLEPLPMIQNPSISL
jgi:hypothetical protein